MSLDDDEYGKPAEGCLYSIIMGMLLWGVILVFVWRAMKYWG